MPDRESDAELVAVRINGRIYEHWTAVSITRPLTALAASFTVTVPWWLPAPGQPLLARPGDSCAVDIGGVTVVSGYIDRVGPSTDPDRVGVQITGRSRAGDIVDCSAIVPGGQLRGLSLLAVASTLCQPFGVGVSLADGIDQGGKFSLVEIEQGETVGEVIQRLCRERGLLCWSDAAGNLIVGRGSRGRAAGSLIHRVGPDGQPVAGNTVLTSQGEFSADGRFSEIYVRGQGQAIIGQPAQKSAAPQGRATDGAIGRYRPLVVNAENAGSPSRFAARAQWEVARRVALGSRVTMAAASWRQTPGGDLWDIGLTVPVVDDVLNLDRDLLISAVTFRQDANSRRADLTLEPPEAHEPAPAQAKTAGGGQFDQWASVRRQTGGTVLPKK